MTNFEMKICLEQFCANICLWANYTELCLVIILSSCFWKRDGLDIGTKRQADSDPIQFVEMTHVNLWSGAAAIKVPAYSQGTRRERDKVCYRAQEGR
jgi:hypothetical protein